MYTVWEINALAENIFVLNKQSVFSFANCLFFTVKCDEPLKYKADSLWSYLFIYMYLCPTLSESS